MKFRVTLVQQSIAWMTPRPSRHLDALLAPLTRNTDLIVLPEMFPTGSAWTWSGSRSR